MTRYEIPAEAVEYFALRDTVAELLKEAGVKKHSRHAVAEVLLEAGVIDLGAFEIEEDEEHQLAVGDTAVWNGLRGEVLLVTDGTASWKMYGKETIREVPVEWLTYEEPSHEA